MRNTILCILMYYITSLTATAQISRGAIMANANTYTDASYTWTATQANLKWGYNCGGRTVYYPKPSLGCVIAGTNWGMPYCWGGYSTILQHNSAMASTNPVISAGDACGGTCSGNGAGPNCASGLDCSGFICRAWGRGDNQKWGTDYPGIHNDANTTPIKAIYLRSGDVYNAPNSHVRFFEGKVSNSSVSVIEAAKGSPAFQRVDQNVRTVDLNTYEMPGYTARVYNNTPSCGQRPSGIALVAKTGSSITITWNAPGATRYDIYWKKHSEGKYDVIFNTTLKPYTLVNLEANTAYDIKVSTVCTDGTWGISDQIFQVTTGSSGLNCNNAVQLTNGVIYSGNNAGGGYNVTTYNCQSGWLESGPENVFAYNHTGGTLTVNLTETGGADVDAFLLSSCTSTNCLLAVNNGVSTAILPAGIYYIVVDGYQGAFGSYALTVSSPAGGGPINDNACNATSIPVGNVCNSINSTNIGATPSTPAPNPACPIEGYKDVWFKFVIPNVVNPQVTIRTMAGTLDDAVMEVYYGSCSSLTYIVCEDDNNDGNGSRMPVINLEGGANYTIWVRVWGWNGGAGTFSICVLNYNSQNFGNGGVDIVVIDPNLEDRGQSTELIPTRQLVHTCEVSVSGSDISVSNVDPNSEYILLNSVGQVICQGKVTGGNIRCSANVTGVYLMSIVDGAGNKCVQKIFVN